MASHPSSDLYKPTEIEEAYAVYVYDKLFSNFPVDGKIHLESKPTQSILQRSGVEPMLLNIIWKVADTDNSRCLAHMAQFHVVMRLIALAQDGLLEKELNRAFSHRDKLTPVQVFQKALWMSSSYEECPLPIFEGLTIPSDEFLQDLSRRMRGTTGTPSADSCPSPAPSPIPISRSQPVPSRVKTSAPHRQQHSQSRHIFGKLKDPPSPLNKAPVKEISVTNKIESYVPAFISVKNSSADDEAMQSAIKQIETLGMNEGNTNLDNLKDLDPENLELLQEQAALQRAIIESNNAPRKPKKPPPHPGRNDAFSEDTAVQRAILESSPKRMNAPPDSPKRSEIMSEEEALQKAIYESTHEASPKLSPPRIAVAAAPPKKENWLRMTSFDSDSDRHMEDEELDPGDGYKRKEKKGDKAYIEYLKSKDSSYAPAEVVSNSRVDGSQNEESDKKPAAKPTLIEPRPSSSKANTDKSFSARSEKSAPKAISRKDTNDSTVDEYPQAVQELVMNGFPLEKAIQGYKMLGDNFDDIVLFLTSNKTVKELVINGFNIHKVVQAHDLIGDNMDDLLAYLLANET